MSETRTSQSAHRCAQALLSMADEAQSLGMSHAARALATAALARASAVPRVDAEQDAAFAALLTRARRVHGVEPAALDQAVERTVDALPEAAE